MPGWQEIRVTIASGNEHLDAEGQFDAYTTGETWNGWLVPYFTESEGKRVAAWSRKLADHGVDPEAQEAVEWDAGMGSFLYTSPFAEDEPESPPVESRHVNELGATLYGIGGCRWAWELA